MTKALKNLAATGQIKGVVRLRRIVGRNPDEGWERLDSRELLTPIAGLDPSFGIGGISLQDYYVSSRGQINLISIDASARQADGKVVSVGVANFGYAGGMFVARFNPDGSIDRGFGSNGVASAFFSTAAAAKAVAIAPDGKIVVGGFTIRPGSGSEFTSTFAAARFNANGTLDQAFGNHGTVTTQFAGQSSAIQGIAVQADGKVVAVGAEANAVDLGFKGIVSTDSKFALVRYNTNGSLDGSFGVRGTVTTPFVGSRGADPSSVAIQKDGKIVAAGLAYFNTTGGIVAARYATNGALDYSFNGNGKVFVGTFLPTATDPATSLDNAGAVVIQADGKIVATNGRGTRSSFGITGQVFTGINSVARFNSNGTIDAAFGTRGLANVGAGTKGGIAPSSLALQPDGRILAAGYYSTYLSSSVGVFRLNPDGSPDSSFGAKGLIVTKLGNTAYPAPTILGVYALPNGQVLASIQDTNSHEEVGLARYGRVTVVPTRGYLPAGAGKSIPSTAISPTLPGSLGAKAASFVVPPGADSPASPVPPIDAPSPRRKVRMRTS